MGVPIYYVFINKQLVAFNAFARKVSFLCSKYTVMEGTKVVFYFLRLYVLSEREFT
jgi:hypothetical protein